MSHMEDKENVNLQKKIFFSKQVIMKEIATDTKTKYQKFTK